MIEETRPRVRRDPDQRAPPPDADPTGTILVTDPTKVFVINSENEYCDVLDK
jgi:hypothetical protein